MGAQSPSRSRPTTWPRSRAGAPWFHTGLARLRIASLLTLSSDLEPVRSRRAPCRSERLAKYNQLLRIEEELGTNAKFAGANLEKEFDLIKKNCETQADQKYQSNHRSQ